jgi:hypothetical protein
MMRKNTYCYLLMQLKSTRRSDSSMIAIGVEAEYRFVARLISGLGLKGESNAPIAARSEVVNFLRLLKLIR